MSGPPPSPVWSAAPPPSSALWTRRRADQCVTVGGGCSVVFALIMMATLAVSGGNQTETANATIFYLLSLFLFLICALSSILAVQKRNKNAAVGFVGVTAVLAIVMFSFMIADAAVPECEENVLYFFRCSPGEKQNALLLVSQDAAIIFTLAVFGVGGLKLFGFLRTEAMATVSGDHRDGGMSGVAMHVNVALDSDG